MTHDKIVSELVNYLLETNPLARKLDPIPRDQSLHELGILDSSGILELVAFIEDHWSIAILDSELTDEMFGGLDKMASLVGSKLGALRS